MVVTSPELDKMPEILDPGIRFFEHQKSGIARMWNMNSFLLADDMGLGKSLQTLAVCAVHAHLTKRLRGTDTAVLVVCPPSLKRNWFNETSRFTRFAPTILDGAPKKRVKQIDDFIAQPGHKVLICNYEQIGKHLTHLNSVGFSIVVADECFVAGTQVSTPTGDKAIEDLRVGDVVYGFDHASGEVVETRVRAVGQKESSTVMPETGSTPNHPYWVEGEGYLPAGDIREGDVGYAIRADPEGVRVVRERLHGSVAEGQILHQEVLQPVPLGRPGVPGAQPRKDGQCPQASRMGGEGVQEDEGAQPLQGSRDCRQDPGDAEGQWPLPSRPQRGEWQGTHRGREASTRASASRVGGVGNAKHQAAAERLPIALQDRPGQAGYHAGGRVRRVVSHARGQSGTGREEDRIPGVQGVDHLEILESRDPERYAESCRRSEQGSPVAVYNLETESSNYFAGGLLVHNCHYVKNPQSMRTQAFQRLNIKRKFMLTGTPMQKSVEDLWVLLDQVQPGQWGTFWGFCQRFAIYGGFEGKAVVGVKNEAQLTENLNRVMIRRLSKDVLDLPEVQFIRREVDLGTEQLKLYNRAVKDMILEREDGEDGEEEISTPMVRFLRLSQICTTTATVREDGKDYSAKFDAAMIDLEDLLDAGRKVVVFTKFRDALGAYHRRIARAHPGVPVYELHGEVPIADRQSVVDSWSAQPGAAVILCMIQVAGVGLNMTSSSDVQFLDKDVTPANNAQAVARVHRIGQGGHVRVYEYHVRGTIEARIDAILASKSKTADQVVENKSLQALLNEALDEER